MPPPPSKEAKEEDCKTADDANSSEGMGAAGDEDGTMLINVGTWNEAGEGASDEMEAWDGGGWSAATPELRGKGAAW